MRRLAVVVSAVALLAACSEPPRKELDRAQGAIDAARAAGAEEYAHDPFTAATTALQEAHAAVEDRDYRLALSRAVEASEQAQEAARAAADGKAAARSSSETALGAATALFAQLQARITAAEAARVPAKDLKATRTAASGAASALQEARAQMAEGKYVQASDALTAVRTDIEAQIHAVNTLIADRAARTTRRRGTGR